MKNRNVLKIIYSLILSSLVLTIMPFTYAALPDKGGIATPQWDVLIVCDNILEKTEGEKKMINIYASTDVQKGFSGVSAQLQKLGSDGKTWENVDGKYWEAFSTTKHAYVLDDHIKVDSGSYRLFIDHSAYVAKGIPIETFYAFSNVVIIP